MECAQVLLGHFHHEHPVVALGCHARVRKAQDLAKPVARKVALAPTSLPAPCGRFLQAHKTAQSEAYTTAACMAANIVRPLSL